MIKPEKSWHFPPTFQLHPNIFLKNLDHDQMMNGQRKKKERKSKNKKDATESLKYKSLMGNYQNTRSFTLTLHL